jgi:hypothetical protein
MKEFVKFKNESGHVFVYFSFFFKNIPLRNPTFVLMDNDDKNKRRIIRVLFFFVSFYSSEFFYLSVFVLWSFKSPPQTIKSETCKVKKK